MRACQTSVVGNREATVLGEKVSNIYEALVILDTPSTGAQNIARCDELMIQ
jgi:hypothetical protein